jgi:two-component system response regulator ChvI
MPEIECHGDLALDRQAARALWQGQDVAMTEYKIVAVLVSHKGSLQTYRAIYDLAHYEGFVAGSGEHGHTTNVRSMVKRIRKKFMAVDPGFSEIKNMQRIGYSWLDPQR